MAIARAGKVAVDHGDPARKKAAGTESESRQSHAGAASAGPVFFHRKAACACGGGCPACQAPSGNLKVSQPDDATELEADRIADQVMRTPVEAPVARAPIADTPVKVAHHHAPNLAEPDAKCDECSEEEEPEVLRKEAFAAAVPPPEEAASSVRNALSSGGRPLDPETRDFFEPRFGVDLGHVRVHTGASAEQSARSVNAQAYAVGPHVVFGAQRFSPGSDQGRRLLAHELAHVVQQTAPIGAGRAVSVTPVATPVLARTVDEWLGGSVDVSRMGYTRLLGEIDELTQYLERQTSSSADTVRIEEALAMLRAEVNRREAATAAPRAPARGRRRREAPASAEPLPERYPRILTAMTSVAYADAEEMRVEYDLIMQWLAREEISAHERRILTDERDSLAPQLRTERERVVTERHAARVRAALTPAGEDAAGELESVARIIEGISPDPANEGIFYIYEHGERIAISREQAEGLRASLATELSHAARRIDSSATYYWERYNSQLALNRDSPIIAGISGWLGDVEDPADELRARYFWIRARVRTMQAHLEAGRMVEAAAILASIEHVSEEIRSLARAFYEGYIEGAEIAVHRLEITRNASFAIAGSIAAVVAAPVVAGFVGAGGLGLTGASATVATIGGTGLVVGTGMAGVRGTSAAVGTLAAGGSWHEVGAAFTEEAATGFREGFLAGAGGGAARSIGLAIGVGGSLTREVAMRVGGEMLVNGTTAMVDSLWQSCRSETGCDVGRAAQAAVIAAAQAVPGALLGGSRNPIVRDLVAPFTAAGTAYLAARANGASSETALEQAGVALASNILMSRATHGSDADAALADTGRSMGASVRSTAVSTGRSARAYVASAMIGTAAALPPLRSGFGGPSVVLDAGLPVTGGTSVTDVRVVSGDADVTVTPPAHVESTAPATASPDADVAPPPATAPAIESDAAPPVTPVAAPPAVETSAASTPVAGTDAAPVASATDTAVAAPPSVAPVDVEAVAAPAPTSPPVAVDVAPPVTATSAAAADTTVATPSSVAPADTEAMGMALTAELGLDAPSATPSAGSRADQIANAHGDAVAAGWVDAAGDPVPGGPVDVVVGMHGDARDRRTATGHTGSTRESAHIGATSLLRTLIGYSRRMATTVLLPRAQHQAFDHHWMRWISNRRRAIRAFGSSDFTAPLSDVLDAQRQALRQTPGLSPETRSTLEGMLEREFHDLASDPATMPDGMNTRVPLPAVWGS